MKMALRKFDMQALYAAVDATRVDRYRRGAFERLVDLGDQRGAAQSALSISTVKGIARKGSVTSAVVLQILRWLGRTAESFLAGTAAASQADERLPEPGPGRILHFDTRAVHAALDAERAHSLQSTLMLFLVASS
jgi:hypothetical protein